MFIGIDHGTSAMRFAGETGSFRMTREEARSFVIGDLGRICPLDEIEGIAVCYSMGDNFSTIRPLSRVRNRGVVSREGAGEHIGGGTRVFDEVLASGLPAIAIPGINRGSPTDPRFKAYSHQASPEKIGVAYEAVRELGDDVVVSDISSNTVSLLVKKGKLIGAIDACVFAPGMEHGAIDVDAIRQIDWSEITANEAFMHAGLRHHMPPGERARTLAMFAAMECAGLLLLSPGAKVALAGSCAGRVSDEVERLLSREVRVFDEWCGARGLARIAREVFSGATEILGIGVED
ncbi:MAG: methanogenesis marker 12 protein [Methanoregulaceae archaeon]|nr:methanogenesis marker 12 protein [Methanoregulaceae archaeon]